MKRYRNRMRVFRKLAVVLTFTFAWSAIAAPVHFSPPPATAQGIQQVFPVPGAPFAWEGSSGSVKTVDGNKLTSIPIVGWTAKGGMPVDFALHHNSSTNASGEIGWDWRHSFRITIAPDIFVDGMRITWGDGRSYVYADNF